MSLTEFFAQNPKAALCFSGGVDSVYLLHAALAAGADVRAYYVDGAFQPSFQLEDAKRAAAELGAALTVLEIDMLGNPDIRANGPKRCYHCKKAILGLVIQAARADGYTLLLDGTNASDDEADRPGARALAELGVRSPLRECALRKDEIRARSKEAGLFTWSKAAYSCLATRIATGRAIRAEDLRRIEYAEEELAQLGFSDFRVRLRGNNAVLELTAEQFQRMLESREAILGRLLTNFGKVYLDMEDRK